MKTLQIHFIRHGETPANSSGLYIGKTDINITMDSADELERAAAEGVYPFVGAVYSSPLKRAMQSAILMFPGAEIIPVENISEYNFGDFEGKSALELEEKDEYKAWIGGKLPAPPNGETTKDFTVRVCIGLRQIVEDMLSQNISSAAVVTHGGVIMTLFDAAAMPRRKKFEWMTDAGHGYSARITPSLYHSSGIIEIFDAF